MKAGSSSNLEEMGPKIGGTVTYSEQHRAALAQAGIEVKSEVGQILWDTGASATCFDATTVTKLGLAVIDRAPHGGPLGFDQNAPRYEGQVIINGYSFHVARASAGYLARFGLIALIGRDILSRGRLEYDGRNGIVTFKF